MDIGLRIGEYLKAHGIKQAFLVQKTGLSAGVVSDICTGTRKGVDTVEYYKICKALGVSMETFVEG